MTESYKGRMKGVKIGDTITLLTEQGKEKTYILSGYIENYTSQWSEGLNVRPYVFDLPLCWCLQAARRERSHGQTRLCICPGCGKWKWRNSSLAMKPSIWNSPGNKSTLMSCFTIVFRRAIRNFKASFPWPCWPGRRRSSILRCPCMWKLSGRGPQALSDGSRNERYPSSSADLGGAPGGNGPSSEAWVSTGYSFWRSKSTFKSASPCKARFLPSA